MAIERGMVTNDAARTYLYIPPNNCIRPTPTLSSSSAPGLMIAVGWMLVFMHPVGKAGWVEGEEV